MSDAYKKAGVDIEAGYEAVERMKSHAARTWRAEVLSGLGGFGSLFRFDGGRFEEPVLVSGTDGVGTKLMIAFVMDRHDTIGVDCVAMVVNDIAALGAEPLFFLDYIATGKLDPQVAELIVKGIADGCEQAGCALVGGETAEMPGFYKPEQYDLAGFGVGVVERSKMVDGTKARVGDVVLGLSSSGLHSNGFSLVRRLLFEERGWDVSTPLQDLEGWDGEEPETLGELLLTPTKIYVRALQSLRDVGVELRGIAHITGGGFEENLPRMISEDFMIQIERGSWEVPPVFKWLKKVGNLSEEELLSTFNCGVGMALIVDEGDVDEVMGLLERAGESVAKIGWVEGRRGAAQVECVGEKRW